MEQPLRKITWQSVKIFYDRIGKFEISALIPLVMVVFLISLTIIGLASPQAASNYQTPLQKELAQREKTSESINTKILSRQKALDAANKNSSSTNKDKPSTSSSQPELNQAAKKIVAKFNLTPTEYQTLQQNTITAIGDSMLVNIGPTLQQVMPVITNGQVGRQPGTATDLLATIKSSNQLSNNILIMLGTNGQVTSTLIDQVINLVGPSRQVYWVNNYVQNRSWISQNEAAYTLANQKYQNFHLIDWASAVKNHRSWLGPDDIHPNNIGDKYLTNIIGTTIANTIKAK